MSILGSNVRSAERITISKWISILISTTLVSLDPFKTREKEFNMLDQHLENEMAL